MYQLWFFFVIIVMFYNQHTFLASSHFWVCPMPGMFVFTDISGIVGHHCFNFLSISIHLYINIFSYWYLCFKKGVWPYKRGTTSVYIVIKSYIFPHITNRIVSYESVHHCIIPRANFSSCVKKNSYLFPYSIAFSLLISYIQPSTSM